MREEPGIFHNGDARARKFLEFHSKNPSIYTELARLALQARRAGYNHYTINGLFEVLRWRKGVLTTDPDFKLNNNYRAYYSRLLMSREPALSTFFTIREQRKPFDAEVTP